MIAILAEGSSPSWEATLGLVGVFFVFFPLLVHALVGLIAAQIFGERKENQAYARREHERQETQG
jgi:hypothetical protein